MVQSSDDSQLSDPILSPAWSPDGLRLAYVSLRSRQTGNLCTGGFTGFPASRRPLTPESMAPGLASGWAAALQ